MRRPEVLTLFFLLLGITYSTSKFNTGVSAADAEIDLPFQSSTSKRIQPSYWRKLIPVGNLITTEKVALGQALFFDKRISADGSISCAACHDPAAAFTSKEAVAIGMNGQKGTRNAPTILNAMFSESYFWDGRARSLEEQVKQPLLNSVEMGMQNEAALTERVSSIDEYRRRFRRVFPREGITLETIARAIAAYERTLLSRDSPFDRFLQGEQSAMTVNQQNGWKLFRGKAKCIECHTHSASTPFFTDFKFYNTGVMAQGQGFESIAFREVSTKTESAAAGALAHTPEFSELGRFLVTRQPKDIGAFKTPTLRDIELTGPYMHNGSIKTILEVIRFYNQGGVKNPYLNEKMQPLDLTDAEISNLVEFLRALTSDDVLRMTQSTTPQSRTPVKLPTLRSSSAASVRK